MSENQNSLDESKENQLAEVTQYFRQATGKDRVLQADCDQLPKVVGEFGLYPTNPAPVNGPVGEIKYLNRLRCECRQPLFFHRIGTVGVNFIKGDVDIYETVCTNSKHWDILFFHMYHPRRSAIGPAGYGFSNYDAQMVESMFGLGTNKFDADFPYGLETLIRPRLDENLVKEFSSAYKEIISSRRFVRPVKHLQKLQSLNKIAELPGDFVKELLKIKPVRPGNTKSKKTRGWLIGIVIVLVAIAFLIHGTKQDLVKLRDAAIGLSILLPAGYFAFGLENTEHSLMKIANFIGKIIFYGLTVWIILSSVFRFFNN